MTHRFGLKHPHVGVFAHFVPPPEADEDAPADVLDRPEIKLGQQSKSGVGIMRTDQVCRNNDAQIMRTNSNKTMHGATRKYMRMPTYRAQEDDENEKDDEIEAKDGRENVDEERGDLEGDVEEDDALVWRALE